MIRHLIVVAALGSGIAVVACGGGIDSSCGSYFDELSSLADQCGGGTVVDPNERSGFLLECDALAKAPGAANLAAEIDQCTAQLKAANCNNAGALDCTGRGTLVDGTACAVGFQCTGGICVGGAANSNSELTCGTCASYVAIGGACGSAMGTCDPTTAFCDNGKCAAYVPQGGACMQQGTTQCTPGLVCGSDATCGPLPGVGAMCTFECASPNICENSVCAAPVAQGGACPMGDECASGLTCDTQSKTCVAPTFAQAGAACGFVNDKDVQCALGLSCKESGDGGTGAGICTAPKSQGASCVVGNDECGTGYLCIDSTCQVPDYTVCQ